MKKTLTALVAGAAITVAAVATPTSAEARRGWWGPGIVGGLFAGALIASAFARPYYGGYYGGYYRGGYYNAYYPGPVSYDYYAPAYAPAYYYAPGPYYNCVRWRGGYRYRVC
jgi:hypothetical protein